MESLLTKDGYAVSVEPTETVSCERQTVNTYASSTYYTSEATTYSRDKSSKVTGTESFKKYYEEHGAKSLDCERSQSFFTTVAKQVRVLPNSIGINANELPKVLEKTAQPAIDTIVRVAPGNNQSSGDENNTPKKHQQYDVEKIINKRGGEKGTVEYLVKWRDYPPSSNSWEPISNLNCDALLRIFEKDLERRLPAENETERPLKRSKDIGDKRRGSRECDRKNKLRK